MSNNVIKFGKVKKQITRVRKEAQAAENKVKFGRKKSEKLRDKSEESALKKHVDDHEIMDK